MKRVIAVVLSVLAVILLSGCSTKEAITSDKQEYIVSALGFDASDNKIKMSIEAIVVNTDDLEEDKENRVIIGEGTTIDEAYNRIISQITQPLSLGHNAVTVIGESVNPQQMKDIFEFCKENNQINIATMLIFSNSAEELLSSKPISSVTVGYDIMSMLEVGEEKQGIVLKNRLYEVVALNSKPQEVFWLPYVMSENEKFSAKGLAVFRNNKMIRLLNNEETVILSLVTDSLKRGETVIQGKRIKTEYCKVTYNFTDEKIDVNVRLKADDKTVFKSKAEELLQYDDIFGLGNIISQKEPKLWERNKKNYADYYKKAVKRVNVYE